MKTNPGPVSRFRPLLPIRERRSSGLNPRPPFLLAPVLLLALAAAAVPASAQTYALLHCFGGLTEPTGCQSKAPLVRGPDGTLYGTTTESGYYGGSGTVFKIQPDGTGFALLKDFTNSADGVSPWGGLVLSGATLYGTTYQGGCSNYGTVFQINTDGTGFAVIKNFGYTDGAYPEAGLVLSGPSLYGTTQSGGTGGVGTVFEVNTNGTDFAVLHSFAGWDGSGPAANMVLSGQTLYGTTTGGGVLGPTIFQINTDGSDFGVVCYYQSYVPAGGVVLYGTNYLFGATRNGGSSGQGTVFELGPFGSAHWTVLENFQGTNGAVPAASLISADGTLYGTTSSGGTSNLGTVFSLGMDGSNFTVLKSFTGSDGNKPSSVLYLSGATLYGTTFSGGISDGGTVFKVNTNGGEFLTLKNFEYNCTDGTYPVDNLAVSGTTLYGITDSGGSSDNGTLFKINTDGSGYGVLRSFSSQEMGPSGGLFLSGNTLYGNEYDWTLFSIGTDGSGMKVLLSGDELNGMPEYDGFRLSGSTLVGTTGGTIFSLSTNGTSFAVITNLSFREGFVVSGMTMYGVDLYGTVLFKLNTDGSGFADLKDYNWWDDPPTGYLTLSGTTLYGTTRGGAVFSVNADGSNYTVLAQLTGNEGTLPQGLVLAGNTLYGTTFQGGDYGAGTVFQVNTDGTGFKVLKQFTGDSPGDGQRPCPIPVVSGTTLYGTAGWGGSFPGGGVLFSLSLSPPVSLFNSVCNGTNFTFAFQAQSNLAYTVEYSDDLSATNWQRCYAITGDGSLMPCCIPMTNSLHRFFRVHQQ